MYAEKGRYYLAEDDSCNTCTYKTDCPLMITIYAGLVEIVPEDLHIGECALYEEQEEGDIIC
jgi:hypothetical protein